MDELILKNEEGVATLTINRADKMNAMTTEMWYGLLDAMAELEKDDGVKVVVLTGAGHAFCAGSDVMQRLSGFVDGKQPERSRRETVGSLPYAIGSAFANLSKPIIAALNGVAAGAGLSMALLSDIRIASDQARFAASWVRIGLSPDAGGTFLLPRVIGMDRALELMLTGEIIDAAEAARVGLVTRVVPHAELLDASLSLARKIAQGPSVAVEFTKRAAYRGMYNTFSEQLDLESYGLAICRATEDHQEGIRAFQEKRPPVYRGR